MLTILEEPGLLTSAVPVSVVCYEKMSELGLVDEGTELIRGVIFEKMSKSPLHFFMVDLMAEILRRGLPPDLMVRVESSLRLADSCPEPDLCVVPGPRDLYAIHHPRTALLVIEVAISSEALDRAKAAIYAEAKVGEYWIVMPQRRAIERFTHPQDGVYTRQHTIESSEVAISMTVPGFSVTLDRLLPKP
ncbi:MAG: hypothetical protein JWM59_4962 [Verrucomicrobiales bacterium]|nr:hypothetical protein [Verrucomicrobiales bacterium]